MLTKLLVVGKLKDKMLQQRCEEYLKWCGAYGKSELKEIPDSTPEKEAVALLKELEKEQHATVIVLSEEGKSFTSTEFAQYLGKLQQKIIFVIGGPMGLTSQVKKKANLLWSLSSLTFTHEMARLLLCEQLFRAETILHGGKYHHDGPLP